MADRYFRATTKGVAPKHPSQRRDQSRRGWHVWQVKRPAGDGTQGEWGVWCRVDDIPEQGSRPSKTASMGISPCELVQRQRLYNGFVNPATVLVLFFPGEGCLSSDQTPMLTVVSSYHRPGTRPTASAVLSALMTSIREGAKSDIVRSICSSASSSAAFGSC